MNNRIWTICKQILWLKIRTARFICLSSLLFMRKEYEDAKSLVPSFAILRQGCRLVRRVKWEVRVDTNSERVDTNSVARTVHFRWKFIIVGTEFRPGTSCKVLTKERSYDICRKGGNTSLFRDCTCACRDIHPVYIAIDNLKCC